MFTDNIGEFKETETLAIRRELDTMDEEKLPLVQVFLSQCWQVCSIFLILYVLGPPDIEISSSLSVHRTDRIVEAVKESRFCS